MEIKIEKKDGKEYKIIAVIALDKENSMYDLRTEDIRKISVESNF